MKKVRLVKVAVKPFFVIDDGENIMEIDHETTIIPAKEWKEYSSVRFQNEIKKWQKELDKEDK